MMSKNSSKLQQRIANSRKHVCRTAAALFVESNYDRVTIEQIVQQSGIARSTFYRFFADKQDLLVNIVNPVFELATSELSALEQNTADSLMDGLVSAYLAVWSEYREGLIFSTTIGQSLFPLIQQKHDEYAMAVARIMTVLHNQGRLRNNDPRLSTILLAQTAVTILRVYQDQENCDELFRQTVRGALLT